MGGRSHWDHLRFDVGFLLNFPQPVTSAVHMCWKSPHKVQYKAPWFSVVFNEHVKGIQVDSTFCTDLTMKLTSATLFIKPWEQWSSAMRSIQEETEISAQLTIIDLTQIIIYSTWMGVYFHLQIRVCKLRRFSSPQELKST